MPDELTMLRDLIDPEVMADMIAAKLPNALRVSPFAAVDNTLEGQPGSTVTVPVYEYIGDAVDVEEGAEVDATKLSTGSFSATVKTAAKDALLTDVSVLSGYGNPVGAATTQLSQSLGAKMDSDSLDALFYAQRRFDGSAGVISYGALVDAIDIFAEEFNTDKVLFVHPRQVSQLRHDPDFVSADKYDNNVIMRGEIGTVLNARVVPTRKTKMASYFYKFVVSGGTAVADGPAGTAYKLGDVATSLPSAKIGDMVLKVATPVYLNPVIQLNEDSGEDELAAITVYRKRNVVIETSREVKIRSTRVAADQHYTVALTNNAKAIVAAFAQEPPEPVEG
jgi:N4-gp56 family major capsid protein